MTSAGRLIPLHHLPPGFAGSLDHPPHPPARPRPAATLAILRPGQEGPEVLLLRRGHGTRFIPGAYVFPGGRVDPQDAEPALLPRIRGLDPSGLRERMGYRDSGADLPEGEGTPAHAFLVAALRETFEETGILLAPPPLGCRAHPLEGAGRGSEARRRLLSGSRGFREVIEELELELDVEGVEYVAHWVTPEVEAWRYDTRFFAVEIGEGCQAFLDGKEMVEACWLTAPQALKRNREGTLPLVFPTLRTLETLSEVRTPGEFLSRHRGRRIPRLLPELLKREEGIEIRVREAGYTP